MAKNDFSPTTRSSKFSDALANIAAALADVGNVLGRVLSDGKISGTEYLDLLLEAPQFRIIVISLPEARKNWVVLTDVERQAVIAAFATQFDIDHDSAELKIETILTEAGNVYSAVEKIVKSVRKVVAVFKKITPV